MEYIPAIRHIHPTLEFGKDYEVIDNSDWKWPQIKWYNTTIPQPTQAELDTAWIAVQQQEQIELLKKQKSEQIHTIATLSDQLNLLADNLNLVIDELAKTNPNILLNPSVISGKNVYNGIKTILNS